MGTGMGVWMVGLTGSDGVGFLASGTMGMVGLSAEGGPSQVGLW